MNRPHLGKIAVEEFAGRGQTSADGLILLGHTEQLTGDVRSSHTARLWPTATSRSLRNRRATTAFRERMTGNDTSEDVPMNRRADPDVLTMVREHRGAHGWRLLEEFAQLLAIDNDTRDLPALRRNAVAIASAFRDRGAEVDVVEQEGCAPLIV